MVIVQNLPPRPWFPPTLLESTPSVSASAPKPPDSESEIEPAVLSRLVLAKSGKAGSTTVMLSRAVAPRDLGMQSGECEDILFRELVRQAVLLAARDERGLATRDELLDDSPFDAPKDAVGLMIATPELCDRPQMELRPVGDRKSTRLNSSH